ncbi:PBSX family phage terminase large subunit [Spirosoma luteum]|uniref:PBSX family phage terminase large subunit n=1 Tax=Spirosoma luteum TaxID=431553 RepID=UPI00037D674D|nr:phage terminase large subunit [Spirosoma luteum]
MGYTHACYAPVLNMPDQVRYIDIWGGRARGGSHFVTDYFLDSLLMPQYFRGYFMRAVYSDVRDSLWRDFKDRIKERVERGELDESLIALQDSTMTATCISTGNVILSKGFRKSSGGQTAKLKSLAGATAVAIEECEETEEDEFDQLDGSFRTTKAKIQIFRIFNPPKKNHWLIKNHYTLIESQNQPGYYLARPKPQPELLSIFSRYYDNIANVDQTTIAKYESYRLTKPEYYWTVIRGLVSEGAKGRIYSDWIPITPEDFNTLPYPSSYGLDFGFGGDPLALIEVKTHNESRWKRGLIYERGLTDPMLAARLTALNVGYAPIYADSAEPKSIQALKDLGFNVVGVAKGADSIRAGIQAVKSYQNYYVDDNENLTFEYQEYRWQLDADKEPTDRPLGKHDHFHDADRYECVGNKGHVTGSARVMSTQVKQRRL